MNFLKDSDICGGCGKRIPKGQALRKIQGVKYHAFKQENKKKSCYDQACEDLGRPS